MKFIENGSVTTPAGFTASGYHCGIRKSQKKKDISLIFCEKRCAAAAVYTRNLVKGAPLTVTKNNISDGYAQAVICNSGNANTCNADGVEKAEITCNVLAEKLGIDKNDIIIGSTGVIGQPINIDAILSGINPLISTLSKDGSGAAEGIMTTDTVKKSFAVEFEIDGKKAYIGGIAKGSGMINPHMATMLCFVTTDVSITPALLHEALVYAVNRSLNMVNIDGDTSTNDMMSVMASGLAGNKTITEKNADYELFRDALFALSVKIAKAIAKDGEGATKLIIAAVRNCKSEECAEILADSVVSSSLVKAAMFGADANWGRVLCALGYAGEDIDVSKINVSFISPAGKTDVCKNGAGIPFSEDIAKEILSCDEITIDIDMQSGDAHAEAYGCDLTYDYVKINGDYRT
ncbi:MAG: bifunctional glutamate N-acetyltransferase/amino-acid acetyltransferase ArgJ [Clostridia bacterium]|nr:bifunctional glutamate N-acetyltransferase/amino-acid acetyltransferase ArgJ [Clostridia bacterium]